MGLKVIAVDPLPTAPGLALADEAHAFDLADVESVLRIARGAHGVVTLGADYPMPTLAKVCARLSLPGPSIETMHAATNKYQMRERFAKAGITGPRSIRCGDLTAAVDAHARLATDTIFKPTISNGGRGVTKVVAPADLRSIEDAYDRARVETRGDGILVEEFVDGPEFSLELITYRGKTSIVAVTDKLTSGAPHFVELGHSRTTRRDGIS